MLSVSLVELSQDQNDTAQALSNLWDARSLALLETTPAPATVGGSGHNAVGGSSPLGYGSDTVAASVVMGVVVGGSAVAILGLLVLLARRP
jgi:hypothetical protein